MIRQLGPPDASAIRQLRREALEREPQAFSSSPGEDRIQAAACLGRGPTAELLDRRALG